MSKVSFQSAKYLLLLFGLFVISNAGQAQNTRAQKKQAKIEAVKKMVDNQNYIFMAQFANPLGWRTINLNYNYSVVISKDSVDSYLPYFGRAYVAPINPTDPKETGIQFKSKDFDYQKTVLKKGSWEIIVTPRDVKETRKFIFNISDEGYTSLNVTSSNRQSISFNGYITENLPKPQK